MRKLTLLFFSVLLCFETFGQQKIKIEKVNPDTTKKEIVQYRTRANHWSIMGTLGVGWLNGDITRQDRSDILPQSWSMMSGLVNLEYTFSPIWGIFAEYLYNPYGGTSRYKNENMPQFGYQDHTTYDGTEYNFKGLNHEVSLGVSLNILNIFYGCRPQRWQWYANIGAGVSFFKLKSHTYKYGSEDGSIQAGDTSPYWENDIYNIMPGSNQKAAHAATFPIGTTVEWNATRWLAVLANIQYRIHTKDFYDASVKGNTNDATVFAGLGLRWKINSPGNKELYHVRDMAQCIYEVDMTSGKVDSLAKKVDSVSNAVKKLEPRIKALEADMDKLRDSDGDGVPDIRDRHPNTPPNTPVDYYGVPIEGTDNVPYVRGGNATTPGNNYNNTGKRNYGNENCLAIYFATDQSVISSVSNITLAEIARQLEADPSLKIQINSYADEQGVSKGYNNQKLTEIRAKKTKEALIKYGIKADRIVEAAGRGVIKDAPSIDYLPNRRSDICFIR
ncbi:MAG: OmpA family protein [Prevotellaceae bacterium]|jgi:outer membrane protein OmpA-like peptidoglycan-associated protein|nr:OmpA family protein [Prevotellaceae bacterium]